MISACAPLYRLRSRTWLLAGALGCVMLGGVPGRVAAVEAPSAMPAPFATGITGTVDGDGAWAGILAIRAQQAGMHHLAIRLFQQALASGEAAGEVRREWELGLVTALLAQGRHEEALVALDGMPGERDDPWRLRRAIVDYVAGRHAQVAERIDTIAIDGLPPADAAWAHFLRAIVATAARERDQATEAFREAEAASTSAAATAWIRLAEFQAELNADEVTEARLKSIEENLADRQGRRVGFELTLIYAAALERLGRKVDAVRVLTEQRRSLPADGFDLRDKTLLLLGLIAGVDSQDGYSAMRTLLEGGKDINWQRIALQRLAVAAESENGLARAGLPRLLDTLLELNPPHPLREDLLYYRAAMRLQPPNPSLDLAEEDAATLLAEFPGSALRSGALALLASSAWQRQQYRRAADYTSRLRAETTDARARVRLTVLMAECHFNAGQPAALADDFRNAADAYAAAQDEIAKLADEIGIVDAERAAGLSVSSIFYHRVLALLKAGDLDGAATLLGSAAAGQVDPEQRWKAVWNFVRFMQRNGRSAEAFAELEQWGATENAPPGLLVRFLWLLAQLSLETGRPGETAGRVAAVRAFLNGPAGDGVPEAERVQVESSAALLEAQAMLELDRVDEGIRAMDQLRQNFPASNAAIYSFIVQARYLSARGQLVEAQKLLRDLADKHRDSEYAPRALFEAAEQAKKRGAEAYLEEARELLEKLATDYPKSGFVFAARLEQGDILRRLNRFADAEQVYLLLENSPAPSEAFRNVAELALADTLMAQVDNDSGKFDAAISRLEHLMDLPPPADSALRIEAGFKLGYGLQKHSSRDRAAEMYWQLYQRVLGEPRPDQPRISLEPEGRFWMAKALLELGEIEHKAGRRESAFRAYQAIIDHGLPGREVVQARLDALRAGG